MNTSPEEESPLGSTAADSTGAQRSDRVLRSNSTGRNQGTRPRPSRGTSSTERQLMFIDASADRGSSSEAVRVHVMRESHRTRRQLRGATQPTIPHEMTILGGMSSPTQERRSAVNPEPAGTTTREWKLILQEGLPRVALTSLVDLNAVADAYLSSVRLLLPDICQLCRNDITAMNAFLALVASQSRFEPPQPPNIASAQFEGQALESLRLRFADPNNGHEDVTILAVLLLSSLESSVEDSSGYHRTALRQIVEDRGGMAAIRRQNRELYDILTDCGVAEAI